MDNHVVTFGTFDLFHHGHARFLQLCNRIAPGNVTVFINSDEYMKGYKASPVLTEYERMAVLHSCKYVNDVKVCENGRSIAQDLAIARGTQHQRFKTHFLAIGSDWMDKDYCKHVGVTEEELLKWGYVLIYLPYTKEINTSGIKWRVQANGNKR